jgi:hypothetical protein
VADEHERRVGQPDPAPGALEQPHAGLSLEHGQLLRHGRRREAQRVGDRGDRPARVQLAQQPEAAEVQHREATLPKGMQESKSILMCGCGRMHSHALVRDPHVPRLGDGLRRDGHLRQARL